MSESRADRQRRATVWLTLVHPPRSGQLKSPGWPSGLTTTWREPEPAGPEPAGPGPAGTRVAVGGRVTAARLCCRVPTVSTLTPADGQRIPGSGHVCGPATVTPGQVGGLPVSGGPARYRPDGAGEGSVPWT